MPLAQLRATFPVLRNPANRHKAVGFTFEQWRFAFTNTFSEEESRALYERYHIPASGFDLLRERARQRGPRAPPQGSWVNYRNDARAPLLFISGGEDHLMPPPIQRSNARHYKSEGTITEVKEYEGRSHLMPAEEGWRRSPTTRWIGRSSTQRHQPRCRERRRNSRAETGRRIDVRRSVSRRARAARVPTQRV